MSTGAYLGINMSYTPVEYIECNGSQYIGTGVCATNNTKVEIKIKFNDANIQESLFCGRDANSSNSVINNFTVFKLWGGQFRFDFNTQGSNFSHTVNTNTEYTYIASKDGLYENGVSIRTAPSSNAFTSTTTIALFCAINYANQMPGGQGNYKVNYGSFRCYYCKIYENNVLVRDFIPVITNDGIYCLFDLVENKFYFNSLKSAFLGGNTNGQAVNVGEIARKVKKIYCGVNNIARKVIKGYAGISNLAMLSFDKSMPQYDASFSGEYTQFEYPAVAGTQDYIYKFGGGRGSTTPIKSVYAYNKSGVRSSASDLTTQSWYATAVSFNGVSLTAGGKTASGGSSRTNQCLSYDNNLTKSTLSNISASLFDLASCSNSQHVLIGGGTNYSANVRTIDSYSTSFVKTSLTDMSTPCRGNFFASVGNYIMSCSSITSSSGNIVDFYDNSNVRTTTSYPYGKLCWFPLALSTSNYAIFFGGATTESESNAYSDCKAYNSDKVVTSFNAPTSLYKAQGFSTLDFAYVFCNGVYHVYNNNLVLVYTGHGDFNRGNNQMCGKASKFAMIHENTSTNDNIFEL